jgi:hypothetical protein
VSLLMAIISVGDFDAEIENLIENFHEFQIRK